MAVLADGQYELDGALLFGNQTPILVQQTAFDQSGGGSGAATQDTPVVAGDGVRMGVDTLPAMTISLTGIIAAGNGQGGLALDTYEQLAAAWLNEQVRAIPGAYSTLRIRYPGSAGTRAVFGRGRKIAPVLGQVRQGLIGWTADFDCASPYFYQDGDSSLVLTLTPSDIAGAVLLRNRCLNQTFDANVSNWTGGGGAVLAWDGTQGHLSPGSMRVTPPGSSAGVYAAMGIDGSALVNLARADTMGVWVYAAGTLSVPVQCQIAWLNAGGSVISTAAGPAVIPAAATWTPLTAPGVPATGTVTASPRLAYAGTPAAGDIVWADDAGFIENIGGFAPPATPPIVLGGWSDTSNAAANPSARAAWPVFTFAGPVTNPQVTYPFTGQWLMLATTLAVGQTATVDTRPWQRSVLRNDGASLAGAVRGNLLRDLAFPAGVTTVRFSGQDPTGTCRCTVTWRPVTGSIGGST